MRTNEFITYMGQKINNTMKEAQILSLVQKQLEVKKYISIKDKKELIDKIIYQSVYFENGNCRIDTIDCYMYFAVYTIEAYTNLEIDNVENCFDALSESGLLPVVIASLGQEYNDVQTFLNMRCDEILENNSLEMQLGKLVEGILDKIEYLGKGLIDVLDGFSFDKDNLTEIINMFAQE